jgi:hypothetical protein
MTKEVAIALFEMGLTAHPAPEIGRAYLEIVGPPDDFTGERAVVDRIVYTTYIADAHADVSDETLYHMLFTQIRQPQYSEMDGVTYLTGNLYWRKYPEITRDTSFETGRRVVRARCRAALRESGRMRLIFNPPITSRVPAP